MARRSRPRESPKTLAEGTHQAADLDRHDAAADLAARTHSEVAQVLGYTVLLYRAHPDEPKIGAAAVAYPSRSKSIGRKSLTSATGSAR